MATSRPTASSSGRMPPSAGRSRSSGRTRIRTSRRGRALRRAAWEWRAGPHRRRVEDRAVQPCVPHSQRDRERCRGSDQEGITTETQRKSEGRAALPCPRACERMMSWCSVRVRVLVERGPLVCGARERRAPAVADLPRRKAWAPAGEAVRTMPPGSTRPPILRVDGWACSTVVRKRADGGWGEACEAL